MSELRLVNVTGPDGNPTAKFNGVERPEVPPGAVMFFAASSAPPGWLKANGATISRTAYSQLFSVIGTVHGAGDGSTTFTLPDMRGEFPRGWDDGRGVDSGRAFGSSQAEDFKAHGHAINGSQNGDFIGLSGGTQGGWGLASGTNNQIWRANAMSTGGTETRPRNIALLACIKY